MYYNKDLYVTQNALLLYLVKAIAADFLLGWS